MFEEHPVKKSEFLEHIIKAKMLLKGTVLKEKEKYFSTLTLFPVLLGSTISQNTSILYSLARGWV